MVAAINSGGGDWCLVLEANQYPLLFDARSCFGTQKDAHPTAITEDVGQGRTENRRAVVVSSKRLTDHHDFLDLKAFARVEVTRKTADGTTSETRYFALSCVPTLDVLLATVRTHRAIGDNLHWQLVLSFREDAARNRNDNSSGSVAILRQPALNVVRHDTSQGSSSSERVGTTPSSATYSMA